MSDTSLYPLRLEPILQYRMWGGRRLESYVREGLPGTEPYGEAWILSDRDDHPSVVANGPLAGKTLPEVIHAYRQDVFGAQAAKYERFPLLLKFLDAREMLSVQVHPSDDCKELLPPGENGKTEAWVVLEADAGSKIYAGLTAGTTAEDIKSALASKTVESHLANFTPSVGDGLFIEAGTIHALGGGVLVFEVQQNSDVTFRLYDWDRIDAKTGKPRDLQIDQALQSTTFPQGPVRPSEPTQDAVGEKMFDGSHFRTWRNQKAEPFTVGADGAARTIVCTEGEGALVQDGHSYEVKKGDTYLIPASVGSLTFMPNGSATILEIGLPA